MFSPIAFCIYSVFVLSTKLFHCKLISIVDNWDFTQVWNKPFHKSPTKDQKRNLELLSQSIELNRKKQNQNIIQNSHVVAMSFKQLASRNCLTSREDNVILITCLRMKEMKCNDWHFYHFVMSFLLCFLVFRKSFDLFELLVFSLQFCPFLQRICHSSFLKCVVGISQNSSPLTNTVVINCPHPP